MRRTIDRNFPFQKQNNNWIEYCTPLFVITKWQALVDGLKDLREHDYLYISAIATLSLSLSPSR
jgi:hypothetical protein